MFDTHDSRSNRGLHSANCCANNVSDHDVIFVRPILGRRSRSVAAVGTMIVQQSNNSPRFWTSTSKNSGGFSMQHSDSERSTRNFVVLMLMTFLLVAIVPATSFGKDRGRRNGRGRDQSWKCGRFINCHDARDGRRDRLRRNAIFFDDRRDNRWRDNRWRNNRGDNRWRNNRGDSRWWNSRSNDRRRWNRWDDNRRWDNRDDRRSRTDWSRNLRWRRN